jgi:hypothetical protein
MTTTTTKHIDSAQAQAKITSGLKSRATFEPITDADRAEMAAPPDATPLGDGAAITALWERATTTAKALQGFISTTHTAIKQASDAKSKSLTDELRAQGHDAATIYQHVKKTLDHESRVARANSGEQRIERLKELRTWADQAAATLPRFQSEAHLCNALSWNSEARARAHTMLQSEGPSSVNMLVRECQAMPRGPEKTAMAAALISRRSTMTPEHQKLLDWSPADLAKSAVGGDLEKIRNQLADIIDAADGATTASSSFDRGVLVPATELIRRGLKARERSKRGSS